MDEELSGLVERVRDGLKARGSRSISGLSRTFRLLDSYDGNKKVDSGEFIVGLRENGIELDTHEADILMGFFDKDGDGCVNFDEFLLSIRGSLNEVRLEVVERAYLIFDSDGSGVINKSDLEGVYDVTRHPKFISEEMTKEEIFNRFLEAFGDKNGDGNISKEEWIEYYSAVSSNMDNDEHFVQLLETAWGM